MNSLSRRHFLVLFSAAVIGTKLTGCGHQDAPLALPKGLKYRLLSREGDRMSDGYLTPGKFDGMAAFTMPDGNIALIRNHELMPDDLTEVTVNSSQKYDPSCKGGTTTLIVTPERELKEHFVSLAGTVRNCAGGATPWGSWISCEEHILTPSENIFNDPQIHVSRPHGYNFEVSSQAKEPVSPEPLIAMGRFFHEAIAVDPQTNIIYQTEDRGDGLFYRFLPNEPENLKAGGVLEALKIKEFPQAKTQLNFPIDTSMGVEWVKIDEVNPPSDTIRQEGFAKGAAQFSRGEGICYDRGQFYFTCTNGGTAQNGQIWRYTPGTSPQDGGEISLIVQPGDRQIMNFPDNIIMAPWGDLIVCEDGRGVNGLVKVSADGRCDRFAKNIYNGSELAGVCFSPDSKTMFVNIYSPGMTLAIWPENGDWQQILA
ncbi:MAG: DUF839 domain-containing protein [Cyanobacteria bacterium SBLK]|nr:DUF839 domain-containing protein [Cyanobacteria bacterium SBLK]